MADLTNKLKNRARREEQRENWSAAIELYSRALRTSERNGAVDSSLYNRIGDIYLRLDDLDSAVGYYERAILRYAEQDLYTSAIALCNKVLRVQPSKIATYLQLGRLQLETGLAAEARVNYLRYATELLTRGQQDEAEAALEEYVVRTEDVNSALRFAGALVANDRGEEALSLLLRLKERLASLAWDVSPLERPIAAIRGFDARRAALAADARSPADAASAPTVEALEAEMTGAFESPAPPAEGADSIVDLEAELEAAVDEPVEVGEETARGPDEPGDDAEETEGEPTDVGFEAGPPARVEASTPGAKGAASGSEVEEVTPELEVEEATSSAPEVGEAARAPEIEAAEEDEFEPAPAGFVAEPEAPEASEEDERRARVPPEETEPPDGGAPWIEPAATDFELAEPASDVAPRGGDAGGIAEEASEFAEPSAAPPGAPGPGTEPTESPEPWESDGDPGPGRAPSPAEGPERPAAPGPAIPAIPMPDGDVSERPVRGMPSPRRDRIAPEPADAPEADALAPAARLGVELADAEVEETVAEIPSAPWANGALAGLVEPAEPASHGLEPDAAGPGIEERPLETDDPESGPAVVEEPRSGGETEAQVWREGPDPAEVAPSIDDQTGRRHLEAARELRSRGELERAIEELEWAAESASCFLEARALLEDCRAELEAGARAEAAAGTDPAAPHVESPPRVDAPEPARGSEEETEAPVPEPSAMAEPLPEEEPEPLEEPGAAELEPASEESPEPVAEAAEHEPVAEEPPEPVAEPEELEPLPEAAIGPRERSRSSWLLSTARDTVEAEGAAAGTVTDEAPAAGGRPSDETFREWLAAASYDVLKRALEELERREELPRALHVVERMLELRPSESSLHRVRIALAAELGHDGLLPEAYLALAAALADAGDLNGAYGAYGRVEELDPGRPDVVERLRALERRLETAGLESVLPTLADDHAEIAGPGVGNQPAAASPSSAVPTAEPGKDAGEDGREEPPVQVYRGVVQDLATEWPTAAAIEPEADRLEWDRGENVDFDVILAELKDQLAEGVVDEPDGRSRAEVGERLMEMGLLDDAIRELQAAVRGPDAPPKAFELLGEAFIEKGQPRVATRLLAEALERLSGAVPDDRLLGVLYQLGVAYQEADSAARALECYERIFSVDIDYRDVRDRIEACAG